MQLLDHKVTTFSPPELFFTEKMIELLHRLTIDTFRSRATNPKTILVELRNLLADERIFNPKQYEYAIIEARNLLHDENENEINFDAISKSHFIGLISKLQKESKPKDRADALLAIDSLILEHNKEYDKKLLDAIEAHLAAYNTGATPDEKFTYYEKLQTLISFFLTELISSRYSKRFLYRFVSDHFASPAATTFAAGITAFRILLQKKHKKFEIVFKLEMASNIAANIILIDATRSRLTDNINDIIVAVPAGVPSTVEIKLTNFARRTFRSPQYLRISIQAFDAFTALEMARVSLSENLDLIHLGYSKEEVFPEKTVLIMEEQSPGVYYYQFKDLQYELDGNFRNGVDLYNQFSSCISKIEQDKRIKLASIEKIKSAIRYLRLGNTAIEVEHKFLNYWIAMEYLFSDLKDRSDINDIKKYFSRIHTNIYLNRVLHDFHWNIFRLRKNSVVPGYAQNNLAYLKSDAAYNYIIANCATDSPLLAHRAEKMKRILFQPPVSKKQSDLEKLIHKHTGDLELHLSRMYRIRNTIIHNAAINMDIISTTANLKYYITFILCYTITELTDNTVMKCIEDFFTSQEIIYNSLCEEKFPKEKLFNIKTHFDFIT